MQRKKEGFKFEYRYLEDRDLNWPRNSESCPWPPDVKRWSTRGGESSQLAAVIKRCISFGVILRAEIFCLYKYWFFFSVCVLGLFLRRLILIESCYKNISDLGLVFCLHTMRKFEAVIRLRRRWCFGLHLFMFTFSFLTLANVFPVVSVGSRRYSRLGCSSKFVYETWYIKIKTCTFRILVYNAALSYLIYYIKNNNYWQKYR